MRKRHKVKCRHLSKRQTGGQATSHTCLCEPCGIEGQDARSAYAEKSRLLLNRTLQPSPTPTVLLIYTHTQTGSCCYTFARCRMRHSLSLADTGFSTLSPCTVPFLTSVWSQENLSFTYIILLEINLVGLLHI
jgi:hypothetical protein